MEREGGRCQDSYVLARLVNTYILAETLVGAQYSPSACLLCYGGLWGDVM